MGVAELQEKRAGILGTYAPGAAMMLQGWQQKGSPLAFPLGQSPQGTSMATVGLVLVPSSRKIVLSPVKKD